MSLKTLKGIEKIDGFKCDSVPCEHPAWVGEFIQVAHGENSIKFRIQDGPIKEVGVNGCQVDTIISTATAILKGLNSEFPCRENSIAITKLEEAVMWLKARKADRESRNVEGTSQK